MSENKAFNHYFKNVEHLKEIDVYRVLKLFNVEDPCIQHAAKKLLCAGVRNDFKNSEKDIKEAIASLERYLEMIGEDLVGLVVNEMDNDSKNVQAGSLELSHSPIEFILNGKKVMTPVNGETYITYDYICKMVGLDPKYSPTITYASNKNSSPLAGRLSRGEILSISDQMIVNCTLTENKLI